MILTSVNGFQMYYEEAGEGMPVVYVHGGFATLASALDLPRPYDWGWELDFARRCHFVWYDRRGFYRSSSPEDGYDLESQARDLEGLLDVLGWDSAHVIGSSAGGPISMAFAATRPGRVRSLVLAGTGLDLFPRGDVASDVIREQLGLLEREGPRAAFDRRPEGVETSFAILWHKEEAEARGELTTWLDAERELSHRAVLMPEDLRARYYAIELRNMGAYMGTDVRSYARAVRAPTLVIHGSEDRETPLEWGREVVATIPGAELRVFEGGHHSMIIRSARAREAALEFMARGG